MKKRRIIFLLIIIFISVIAVFILSNLLCKNNMILKKEKDSFHEIAQIDGRNIYSSFSQVYYKTDVGLFVPLSMALKMKWTTIDEIIKNMAVTSVYNDGGSTIYYYQNSNKYANKDFYLCKCNSNYKDYNIYIYQNNNSNISCIH